MSKHRINNMKGYGHLTAEQLKESGYSPKRLVTHEISCKGCWDTIDRKEFIDYLNGIYDQEWPLLVLTDDEVYHNEACLNYSVSGHAYPFPEGLGDRKGWIKGLDEKIMGL
jgi:hypothetical protein